MQTNRRRHRLLGSRLVGGLILACLLIGQGCKEQAASTGSASPASSSTSDAAPATADASAPEQTPPHEGPVFEPRPEPLLEGWETPAAAIILTGEQHGYLEPCGCSERQSGGLARRAEFATQLRSRGWPVTGFDLGGTIKRTRRQSQMKFEFTRDAFNTIGYKGLGLGTEDLRLGSEYLFTAYSNSNVKEDFDLPFIGANVTFFDTRDIGTPLTHRVVEIGDVKIGVTAIFGLSYQSDLFPGGENTDPSLLRIDDPAEVLPEVIASMKAEQPDIMLLLAHAKPDESQALAAAFPAFDLVVTAGGPEDPVGDTEPVGDTLLLRVGTKGKNVGIVGFYPDAAEGEKFRFKVVELDRFRFDHASVIDDRMREYQQQLEAENLLENEPAITHPHGAGFEFIGSETCADCHDEAYSVWESSPHHTHGFESLTVAYAQASDDPSMASRVRVDRIYDPECICCHTAGWDPQEVLRFETGFLSAKKSPHLKGVHCENCHGPASRHVELEESGDASDAEMAAEREKMHITAEWAKSDLCSNCHDHENSPDFDFDTYWSQIEH